MHMLTALLFYSKYLSKQPFKEVETESISPRPDGTEQRRLVSRALAHPNYTWSDKEFDIGLVKVAAPFQFTDFVQVPPRYNLVIETSIT